ncbi:MAG: HNH endonuclease [Bdellovibrionales bacterium]|nr:HNH endonuclease [Bdellovibrionales bacterium]
MEPESEWTDEEFRAAVESYLNLRTEIFQGKKPSKKAVYESLHQRFPHRTAKSFEFRMQNISYVFARMGRDWIPGLRPASHISPKAIQKIAAMVSEIEGGFDISPIVFEAKVDKIMDGQEHVEPAGIERPAVASVTTSVFSRSAEVKSWVLRGAKGRCENCEKTAPFKIEGGRPYLEVHHLVRLADGGSDRISNAVALCPNCHREFHFGEKRSDLIEALYQRMPRLRKER